jgi:hypothetical protein
MPIYESTMTYEEMKKCAADGHVCAVCNGPLSVAWDGKGYILRCQDLNHNKITIHDVKNEERIRQYKMDSKALTNLTEKEMVARVGMGKFAQDLKPDERRMLAVMAINYGFDPAMGEMTIYQGRPYISVDGRYRKAQETGLLESVWARPATKDEKEAWEIPPGDYFFRAEVKVKNAGIFVGWGRVFAAEVSGGKGFKPVEKNPQRMAEKRAEVQALRKAFHIDLPSIEEAGTPDDPNVIDSTANVLPDAVNPAQDGQGDRVIGDTDIPANVGELCAWSFAHGKKYNGAWVAQQLGLILAADIKDIKNAYLTIKEITGWEAYKKGGEIATK